MNIKEFKVGEKAWLYYDNRGTEVITETEIISVGRKIVKAYNGNGLEMDFRNPCNYEKYQFWLDGEVGGYIKARLFKSYNDVMKYKEMISLRKAIYEYIYPTSSNINILSLDDLKTIKNIFEKYEK